MNIDKRINFETVKRLVNYSSNIANMYNELYTLEISGKKDCEEYNNIIDLILYTKEKEKKEYENIPNQDLEIYINYFCTLDDYTQEVNSNIPKILFSDRKFYITTRIVSYLELNYDNEESIENFDEFDVLRELEIPDSNIVLINKQNGSLQTLEQAKLNELTLKFNTDIEDISTIFLDELAKKENDNIVKNELLRAKYINSFFVPALEDIYLKLNFNLTLSIANLDEYKDIDYLLDLAYKCAIESIKSLLKKETYDNPKDFFRTLSILKSYLYFLVDDNIVKLINKLYSSKIQNQKTLAIRDRIISEMKDTLNRLQK